MMTSSHSQAVSDVVNSAPPSQYVPYNNPPYTEGDKVAMVISRSQFEGVIGPADTLTLQCC